MSTRPICGFKKIPLESNYYSSTGRPKPVKMQKFARWDGMPMRCPLKGEMFISGSVPEAYVAGFDMTTHYYIAIPA